MANLLNVAMIESIQALHAQQWSARRIARELGVDRETVGKYLRRGSCDPKPANLPTGSAGPKPASFAGLPANDSKPASNAPTGSHGHGPPSQCAAYHQAILAKHEEGLSARRIQRNRTQQPFLTGGVVCEGSGQVRPFASEVQDVTFGRSGEAAALAATAAAI